MARIQLRDTTVRFIDGYRNEAEVLNEPAPGDMFLEIGNLDNEDLIAIGTRFAVEGSNRYHYVTGQSSDAIYELSIIAEDGTFELVFTGDAEDPISPETTDPIDWDEGNLTAAQVLAALVALGSLEPNEVVVTGEDGGPFFIRFTGPNWGNKDIELAANNIDLYLNDEQLIEFFGVSDGNFTLTLDTETTGSLDYDEGNITAGTVEAALEGLSNVGVGNVEVSGDPGGPFTVVFIGGLGDQTVEALTANDAGLDGTIGITHVTLGGHDLYVDTITTPGVTNRITFTPSFSVATGVPELGDLVEFLGHVVEARMGDGDLNYTENKELEYELERGKLDTVREVNDVPMDVTMDAVWEFLTAHSDDPIPTMEDALKRRGLASDWVSSAVDDPCAPYAVDIEIEYKPPCGDAQSEIILLPSFRHDSLDHSIQEATISMTGRCNAKEAIVTRV